MTQRRNRTSKQPGTATGDSGLYDQWSAKTAARANAAPVAVLVNLPSGLQVRATRPHLLWLLRNGRIPDALAPKVEALIELAGSGPGAVEAQMIQDNTDNPIEFAATWTALLNSVWLEAVVEPAFTAAARPGDGEISVSDVEIEDKEYLFTWCQGVDESVATFLDRRAGAVAVVEVAQAGQGIRAGSGDVAGDRPVC